MQFRNFLVALGLVAATSAAALPAAEPVLEERQTTGSVSGQFRLRRFTPTGPPENPTATFNGNQYFNINSDTKYLRYSSREEATWFTYEPSSFTLRSTTGALVPKNQQSFDITVTPVTFAQSVPETVKVTIGQGPLFEVTFQTQRKNAQGVLAPVPLWVSSTTVGDNIFLGKTADITPVQILRFRAEGYVPPVV
jgi:hypothetical protein